METQPSIYPGGIRIDEPVTSITDLLVSAVCFYAFFKLSKQKQLPRSILYFRYYFLLMAIATLLGGLIGHAFLYKLSIVWKIPGWLVSMLGVALIERSAIEYTRTIIKPAIAKLFLALNIVELIIVAGIAISTVNFRWVEFHGAYGLLGVVMSFHLYNFLRIKNRGSRYMLQGVMLAALAALVFTFKIAVNKWFNHLDISHILMAFTSYIFYRAAVVLSSETKPTR